MLIPKPVLLTLTLISLATPALAADCTNAEILALEISGELVAPPAMVDQIEQDLAKIYAADPYLATLAVLSDWVPGALLVRLTEKAALEYQAGEYHDLDALNATYGMVPGRLLGNWLVLESATAYNPVVLGPTYEVVESVVMAEPNGIAGDGDDIIATEVGHYTFKHGWGDCPAGCIKEHYWVYSVKGDVAQLVSEYGDDLRTASGSESWGSLKSHFGEQD